MHILMTHPPSWDSAQFNFVNWPGLGLDRPPPHSVAPYVENRALNNSATVLGLLSIVMDIISVGFSSRGGEREREFMQMARNGQL